MNRRSLRIIGINPGTRYLGIAVLDGSELLDWRVKTFIGKWTKEKAGRILEIIGEYIGLYDINAISLKKIYPARTSKNLKTLVSRIVAIAKRNKIKVVRYSIQELEKLFLENKKANKKNLAERIVLDYPALNHEIEKEKRNRNPYYIRVLEAVALAEAYLISAR